MSCEKTSLSLGMAAALALGISIVFASSLSTTAVMGGSGSLMMSSSPSSYSLVQPGETPAQSNNILQPGVYAKGTIASLQNDKDGNPAWIVSGL